MKKLYCYNNVCCILKISQLRLKTIKDTPHIKRSKDEIEEIKKDIEICTQKKKLIENTLSRLTEIELELYKAIVIANMTVSQAIPYIAETQYISESALWNKYYKNITQDIENIKIDIQ